MIQGLAPDSNLDKALADMIVDGVMDIRAKRTKYHFESDPATKVSSWSRKSCCYYLHKYNWNSIFFNPQGFEKSGSLRKRGVNLNCMTERTRGAGKDTGTRNINTMVLFGDTTGILNSLVSNVVGGGANCYLNFPASGASHNSYNFETTEFKKQATNKQP